LGKEGGKVIPLFPKMGKNGLPQRKNKHTKLKMGVGKRNILYLEKGTMFSSRGSTLSSLRSAAKGAAKKERKAFKTRKKPGLLALEKNAISLSYRAEVLNRACSVPERPRLWKKKSGEGGSHLKGGERLPECLMKS